MRGEPARLLEKPHSRRRELHTAPRAGEERDAEVLLERANGARQRRLRDMQRLGGAAEVQPLGHGHEIPYLPKIRQIHTYSVLQEDALCIGRSRASGGKMR